MTSRSRIIPARAGFTESRRIVADHDWDHPRSRGVYLRKSIQPEIDAGSSPLARGLRGVIPAILGALRIIPARAGFTGHATLEDPGRRGSSPLARGLPRHGGPTETRLRIIPARAGFTERSIVSGLGGADHPRSRGVYQYEVGDMEPSEGSSPLARGLRSQSKSPPGRSRIIPARAGFTGRGRCWRGAGRDHPRSRGVYSWWCPVCAWWGGSSPLARGLLLCRGRLPCAGWIIPARAGFTVGECGDDALGQDHPRSRGVYV